MGEDKSLQKSDTAEIRLDSETTAKVVESLVLRGDISALTPEQRSRFYLQICESLGLTPATLPFAILRLQGKEILYPTRGATDQLAAIHRLTREIVDGPRVIDLAGTKMVLAVCRATHPNGRIETAIATVPLSDPLNAMMKAETKAKRRATLSILGLGMLDESEMETIPSNAKKAASQPSEDLIPEALERFYTHVQDIELPGEGVAAWIRYRDELSTLGAKDRESAWHTLVKRVEEVGKMKNGKAWLKRAIAEEDVRTAQAQPKSQAQQDFETWDIRIKQADGRTLLAMAEEIAKTTEDGPKDAYAVRWAEIIKSYDDESLSKVLKKLEALPSDLKERGIWDPVIQAVEARQPQQGASP